MTDVQCFADDELKAYLVGDVPADRAETIDRHLAGCPVCERAAARLDDASDPMIHSLKRALAPADETLDQPTLSARDDQAAAAVPKLAERFGRYRIRHLLGEGGMGAVWMADQIEPIRRQVAIKQIREEFPSSRILSRFEAERQAIAMMDHPNIAKLFDAGTTEAGTPFFVMEFVKGVPLTQYCDDHQLSIRSRLELFQLVCHAVQHAHQKGIVHRDLKPSNILIESIDGKPAPKVIDFGLAKAVAGERLTDETQLTGVGTLMGTPLYMAPEQASLNAIDVDTRADVFALGVILFELLTGSTPMDPERQKRGELDELLCQIRTEEPPAPSRRIRSASSQTEIAVNRRTAPTGLFRQIRGELDWITLRSLAKDRDQRYQTAAALAEDVDRYIRDEAVSVGPPTTSYRLRRFVRRNKAGLAATVGIFLILVLLGGGAGWVLNERSMRRTETELRVEQVLAESMGHYTEGKLPQAAAAAQKAEGILQFGAGRDSLRKRVERRIVEFQVAENLEEARLLASGLNDQSRYDYEAAIRAYSDAFRNFGIEVEQLEPEEASRRIRESTIRNHLASALDHWGSMPVVSSAFKSRLRAIVADADDNEWRRKVRSAANQDVEVLKQLAESLDVGSQPPSTITLLATYLHGKDQFSAAGNLLRRAQRRYPGDFWINLSLGLSLGRGQSSEIDDVIRFFTAAIALRPQSPGTHLMIAYVLRNKGRHDEALAAYQEAIRLKPDYSYAHLGLGHFMVFPKEDYSAAVAAFTKAIELNPRITSAWNGRSAAYAKLGEPDKCLADSNESLAVDPNQPTSWLGYAQALLGVGRMDEAITAYGRAIELKPDYHFAYQKRGELHFHQGRPILAAVDFAAANSLTPRTAAQRLNLARTLLDSGQFDKAITAFSQLIEQDALTASFWYYRGLAYQRTEQWEKAVADFSKAIALYFDGPGPSAGRAECYANLNQPEKAIADYTKAIRLNPNVSMYWYGRGKAYSAVQKLMPAVADFVRTSELDPANESVRFDLGHAYRGLREWDRSLAVFTQLMQRHPMMGAYAISRGQTYSQMKDWKKAIADFTRAINIDRRDQQAWVERGDCYAELKLWKEAAADFSESKNLAPDSPANWDLLAFSRLAANDLNAYRSVCADVINRFGTTQDPEAAARVVTTCVAAPRAIAKPADLIAMAQLAGKEDPVWSAGLIGAAYFRADQFNLALECFQRMAKEHPPRAWELLFQAMIYHRLNQTDRANERLTQARAWIAAAKSWHQESTDAEPTWSNWQEEVGARMMLLEAQALESARPSKRD